MTNRTHSFKGFDDFIEVFEGGLQTDSSGESREWTEAELDSIVTNFNADDPAPAVVGHPKSDAPAYGWVSEVKREGKKILAKFVDVDPAFENLVVAGRYRKRSIALDPADGGFKIRHIGWLGAAAPAIEGLKPVAFANEAPAFEFESDWYTPNRVARMMRSIREFIIDKFDVETADQVVADWEIDSLQDHATSLQNDDQNSATSSPHFSANIDDPMDPSQEGDLSTMTTETKQFTQADVDAAVAQAQTEASTQNTTLQEQLDAERTAGRVAKFQLQIDAAIDEGRLTPAQSEGMAEFMASLPADAEKPFEFSRPKGDGKETETVKQTPMQYFEAFVGSLGKQVDMSESDAGSDLDAGTTHDFAAPQGAVVDQDGLTMRNKALEYQAEHPEVSFMDAYNAVGGK